jgi:hypothetical protein
MSRRSVLFLFATIFVILTNCIAEGTINTQTLSIDTAGEALTADSPLNYLIPKPVFGRYGNRYPNGKCGSTHCRATAGGLPETCDRPRSPDPDRGRQEQHDHAEYTDRG